MLSPEILKQIRRLELRARRAVQSLLGGEYHSVFKGTGLSFDEVREYQPGDDVRGIEWNVTARMGHAFIKRYIEERELTVMLLVDQSASLQFGTGASTKRAAVAELAALIAFAAEKNNDRIGLLAFSDIIEKQVPPAKGSRHVLRLLSDILNPQSREPGTNLKLALEQLLKTQKRRAIVFVFSDFIGTGHEDTFRRAAFRHDLIAVRVQDARELSWPNVGFVQLQDAETGQQFLLDTASNELRSQFAAQAEARREAFQKLVRSSRADGIEISTDGQHFEQLLKFFRMRERRRN